MIRGFLASALVAGGLCGCVSQTAMFTVGDAQTAAAVANAAGLTGDAQCWQTYGAIASATVGLEASPAPQIGLLTAVETKRAIQATMGSPSCLPITTQLLGEVLKVSSPQGAGIATVLGF
jgi:hypothetical protein